MSASRPALLVAAAAALAVAGCGGSAAAGAKLSLAADPGGKLRYDKKTLHARAGKVTIAMANPSSLSHSVAIEGNGVDAAGEVVAKDGTSIASAALKPGTYTFYCAVPGHREAGMQGTLTVSGG
jgi:plastocyanin